MKNKYYKSSIVDSITEDLKKTTSIYKKTKIVRTVKRYTLIHKENNNGR